MPVYIHIYILIYVYYNVYNNVIHKWWNCDPNMLGQYKLHITSIQKTIVDWSL